MRLRLPKSNIRWEITTGDAGGRNWSHRDSELVALYDMPDGRVLAAAARCDSHMLRQDEAYGRHIVSRVVEDLTREVGRTMLGVQ